MLKKAVNLLALFIFILTVHDLSAKTGATENVKVSGSASMQSAVRAKRLIFMDFYNQDNDENFKWLETSIGESIHVLVKDKYVYEKIPNEKWQQYFKDNNLSSDHMFNEKTLSAMGKQFGADGVIFGRFQYNSKTSNLTINGRILSVVDGDIMADREIVTGVDNRMFTEAEKLSDYLASQIKDLFVPTDEGALWRAAVAPGWGHFYKQRPTWGYIWAGVVGVAFLYTTYSVFVYTQSVDDYNNYIPENVTTPTGETGLYDYDAAQAKFKSLEDDMIAKGNSAQTAVYVLAAVYALNLIHAYFIEADIGNLAGVKTAAASEDYQKIRYTFSPVVPRYAGNRQHQPAFERGLYAQVAYQF